MTVIDIFWMTIATLNIILIPTGYVLRPFYSQQKTEVRIIMVLLGIAFSWIGTLVMIVNSNKKINKHEDILNELTFRYLNEKLDTINEKLTNLNKILDKEE